MDWGRHDNVLGAISDSQIALLRLFLSLAALVSVLIDPSEPQRWILPTHIGLVLYSISSLALYWWARRDALPRQVNSSLVWIDLVLSSLLIFATGANHSAFFFLYLFVILTACSRLGSEFGKFVTFLATILCFTIGYLGTPDGDLQWSRLLLRPTSLVAFGYVLTSWAEAEHNLRRKLELLREVSSTSNPRFGVDRTAGILMKRIVEFFDADTCVLLEYERESEDYLLRCATPWDAEAGKNILKPPDHISRVLKGIRQPSSAVYAERSSAWRRRPTYLCWDPAAQTSVEQPIAEALPVAEWLGCTSFVAVPLRHHEWLRGYLFVGVAQKTAFRMEDAQFLMQLADQVTPVLEHIRLVDRMASGAAEEERRRIARSVHDRIIQPYIGLQMGLKGLNRIIRSVLQRGGVPSAESQQALSSMESLEEMAREGVDELRRYIYDLKSSGVRGDVLVNSLLRYAAKFEAVTAIRVNVIDRLHDDGSINDRLAGEIFQIATEALSNVRRHTTATAVSLTLEKSPTGNIALRIENEAKTAAASRPFVPRSITERAASLGGRARVSNGSGRTVVRIEIPL